MAEPFSAFKGRDTDSSAVNEPAGVGGTLRTRRAVLQPPGVPRPETVWEGCLFRTKATAAHSPFLYSENSHLCFADGMNCLLNFNIPADSSSHVSALRGFLCLNRCGLNTVTTATSALGLPVADGGPLCARPCLACPPPPCDIGLLFIWPH